MAMAQIKTYLIVTVDPVHIGTGGYRLGRVDNAIVRDPGTNIPKIPGTSISGAARSYAASQINSSGCAGQGVGENGHCGKENCPICYTFGHTAGDKSNAGVINFHDAYIVFFPVFSLAGTVWVTTLDILKRYGLKIDPESELAEDEVLVGSGLAGKPGLNLGWLLLGVSETPIEISQGSSFHTAQSGNSEDLTLFTSWELMPQDIKDKVVITTPRLFSHIVNSNLEVRTSVSIDPGTGAAKPGALFTYEAIPRGAIMAMELVKDDYRGNFQKTNSWTDPFHVAESGLKAIEYLGVGGMGTRGFGRFRIQKY
ncbi:type III-B CRISPR module RAMP protein Cmr4 [Candidatus Poribacteria bacterium]|nr:type III-B CRISPR module RAMP protein Cmr4 [Candidatus Poribacteria bacterium]